MDVLEPPVNTTSVFQLCPYRMKLYYKQPCSAESAVGIVILFLGRSYTVQTHRGSHLHEVLKISDFVVEENLRNNYFAKPCLMMLKHIFSWIWYKIELAKLLYLATFAVSLTAGTFLVLDHYPYLSKERHKSGATALFESLWLWRNIKMVTAE